MRHPGDPLGAESHANITGRAAAAGREISVPPHPLEHLARDFVPNLHACAFEESRPLCRGMPGGPADARQWARQVIDAMLVLLELLGSVSTYRAASAEGLLQESLAHPIGSSK